MIAYLNSRGSQRVMFASDYPLLTFERCREEGLEIAGVIAVVDRLAGAAERIEAAAEAPYRCLVTIDELYPERPDRA